MERSEADVWSTIMNDTILGETPAIPPMLLSHEKRRDGTKVLSFTPAVVERVCNLKSWGLAPDCSKAYWKDIRASFGSNGCHITRTAFCVLRLVDDEADETEFDDIFEDTPRPRLRQLLTKQE